MDHHDDNWDQWSEEHGFDDADTADLGGAEPGDLAAGHDGLDDSFAEDHDGYEPAADDYDHPVEPGPDLLHEGGDEQPAEHAEDPFAAHDAGQDDAGPDDAHDDPGHDDPGHDEQPADAHDPAGQPDPAQDGEPDADHPAFADPDLAGDHDAGFHDSDFPPPLDLGHPPPEPVDGYPWTDPATLGEPPADTPNFDHASYAGYAATPDDLFAYSGMETPAGGDLWSALLGSDDPATSSLARWWGPA